MTGEIATYESDDFGSVRMFEEDGEVYAVADDFAKALGYKDAWHMLRSLDADEFAPRFVGGNKGEREANVINEAGMYHAILTRRSSYVKNPEARERVERFQRWVTHEVLPTIRRHGAYVNPHGAESDEELVARALEAAHAIIARREERIRALESENEGMRPMAELGEAVSASDDSILIGDLGRLLQQNGCAWAGRTRLFERLRGDGFLNSSRSGEKNAPNQRYLDMGLFEVSQRTYRRGDRVETAFTTMVTPKGQAYFLRRYAGVGTGAES